MVIEHLLVLDHSSSINTVKKMPFIKFELPHNIHIQITLLYVPQTGWKRKRMVFNERYIILFKNTAIMIIWDLTCSDSPHEEKCVPQSI
jgi:hypothetical protein